MQIILQSIYLLVKSLGSDAGQEWLKDEMLNIQNFKLTNYHARRIHYTKYKCEMLLNVIKKTEKLNVDRGNMCTVDGIRDLLRMNVGHQIVYCEIYLCCHNSIIHNLVPTGMMRLFTRTLIVYLYTQ